MKKFFKKLLRVAAAVAVIVFAPALAASIATAVPALAPVMTSAFGAPLVGAAIGGATSVATGGTFGEGALIGGTLGFAGPMLGAGTPAGFMGTGYGASAGTAAAAETVAGATAGAGAGAGVTVPPPAAPSTFLGTVGKVASTGANVFTALSAVQQARLAASLADGSTEGLTPEEIALRERYQGELEELATTNRAQYNQLVSQGRDLIARGTANPELAYGQASAATQRAGLDLSRGQAPGMSAELQRRTAIDAARSGGGAAAQEQMRADNAQEAGIRALGGVGSAPQGAAAGLMLQADADRKRRDEEEAERLRRLGQSGAAYQSAADSLTDLFNKPTKPEEPATPVAGIS